MMTKSPAIPPLAARRLPATAAASSEPSSQELSAIKLRIAADPITAPMRPKLSSGPFLIMSTSPLNVV